MNFKNQAHKLEGFLEEEFKLKTPLLVLKDQTVVYKNYKIKKNSNHQWNLILDGSVLGVFKLRAGAIIAAKCHDKTDFARLNEIKILDFQYWQHSVDEHIFHYKFDTTKDADKRDIFLARWELARDRAKVYRSKISSLFRSTFDK